MLARRKFILVVSPNRATAEQIITFVTQTGHEARAVHCGADALRMMVEEKCKPDIVLFQLDLPDMNAYQFTGEVLLQVETARPDHFYGRIPEVAEEQGIQIHRISSEDDNLQAVFDYVVR